MEVLNDEDVCGICHLIFGAWPSNPAAACRISVSPPLSSHGCVPLAEYCFIGDLVAVCIVGARCLPCFEVAFCSQRTCFVGSLSNSPHRVVCIVSSTPEYTYTIAVCQCRGMCGAFLLSNIHICMEYPSLSIMSHPVHLRIRPITRAV